MPVSVTLQAVDARDRLLPVPCRLVVVDNDRVVGTSECKAGATENRFVNLPLHRVYRGTATARGFKVSAQLIPVAAAPETTAIILCLAEPRQVTPDLPNFAQLPEALQRVLSRSEELDPAPAERAMAARDVTERALEARAPAAERAAPDRPMLDLRAGDRRWTQLGSEQRAGLLNLFAKMRSVTLTGGKDAWSYLSTLTDVARDRIHACVDPSLRGEMLDQFMFKEAPGMMHKAEKGRARDKSFKTREPYGNLQLTFFRIDGQALPTLVDADVDDAAGMEHGEQVVRHEFGRFARLLFRGLLPGLPEETTNPYDIHQILIHYQKSNPETPNILEYEPCYAVRVRDTPASYTL